MEFSARQLCVEKRMNTSGIRHEVVGRPLGVTASDSSPKKPLPHSRSRFVSAGTPRITIGVTLSRHWYTCSLTRGRVLDAVHEIAWRRPPRLTASGRIVGPFDG